MESLKTWIKAKIIYAKELVGGYAESEHPLVITKSYAAEYGRRHDINPSCIKAFHKAGVLISFAYSYAVVNDNPKKEIIERFLKYPEVSPYFVFLSCKQNGKVDPKLMEKMRKMCVARYGHNLL